MKKRKVLYLTLFIGFLLSSSLFNYSVSADDTYIGIWINPYASDWYHDSDHDRYIADFKECVDEAKINGINTIVFQMDLMAYHWQDDATLRNLTYPAQRGFTPAEIQTMAEYVRNQNMKIIVAMEILTHLENNAFAYAYPGFMVNEGAWATGQPYTARSGFVENDGNTYQCKVTHVSSSPTEPGTGANWEDYWKIRARSTRNPFNPFGEDLMFSLINELVTVFTAYGQKPEGFCIESDEAYSWLKINLNDFRNINNLDYAETFAMAINNAYNYIHDEIDSNMDVIMEGDMLDPITNGKLYQTSDAIDYINTNVIIMDWRYNLSWYRYDFQSGLFPSVKELTDKGFSVITASWKEPEATKALIWTANMAEGDGDTILGHFYTTWTSSLIPQLTYALADPTDSRIYDDGISAVGESIDASISLIGATQCAQNDTSFGTYPNCSNANDADGFYGADYRDYYYNTATSSVAYYTVDLPVDPVSYWDFEGDADDRMGINDGTLTNGASIVIDSVRGQVVNLDGLNDYVAVSDDSTLDMTDALTVSCWFKLDDVPADFSERVVLLGKHYNEYELRLYDGGKLMALSSDGAGGSEVGVSSWNPVRNWETGRWYHAAWVMDGNEEYLYVDGELMGFETRKSNNGTVAGTHDFNIGRMVGSSYYVDGRMDDVMVFDQVLTPAEIKYLYLTQDIPAPIGYWDFQGNADDRIGSNDGTLVGGASIAEDIRHNEEVLVLDGTDDCVTCGDPAEFKLTGSRSISAWIKPDITTTNYMMVAGRYFWGYSLDVVDGKLRAYMSATTTAASTWSAAGVITEDEWQHVAMTFDVNAEGNDKIIRLYRNGVDVTYSTTPMVGTPTNTSYEDFSIGADDYSPQRYFFSGSINNVKLFDFALSPDQIVVQYQLGGGLTVYSDLLAQTQVEDYIHLDVDFDERNGTTVNDASPEENDGTIYGDNWRWITGVGEVGYSFDIYQTNADSYVSFGTTSSLNLTGSRSISAWIYPDTSDTNYRVIAGKYLWGSSLYIQGGKLKGYVAGTGGSASTHSDTGILTTGEWQHVVMTFDINADSKVVRLYHNGEEVSYSYQTTFSGSSTDYSSRRFTIGADYIPQYYFDGRIDQVKVFDKALTPRQVMYYYLNSDI